MILNERDSRHEHILNVARQMMTAARTAPKGKGIDIIETAVVTGKEIQLLSDTLKVIIPGSVIFVKTLHFGVESTFAALYKSGEMV